MQKKTILIAIAVPVLLLLTAAGYIYIKKYARTAELNRLYKLGMVPVLDKNDQFNVRAELAFYDSLLKLTFPQDKLLEILAFRSVTLLKMGQEKEAVQVFESLLMTRADKNDKQSRMIKAYLALAYLRMGERNNCIHNHSSGSCIFPIQGKGIYALRSVRVPEKYSEPCTRISCSMTPRISLRDGC